MKKMFTSIATVAMLIASTSYAHQQTPGYAKEYATSTYHSKTYQLKNAYDFPAAYQIEVFEKDGTVATGWKVSNDKDTFKLMPDSTRSFSVIVDMDDYTERKVLVCTTLIGTGYELETPGSVSRICSRLWIKNISQ